MSIDKRRFVEEFYEEHLEKCLLTTKFFVFNGASNELNNKIKNNFNTSECSDNLQYIWDMKEEMRACYTYNYSFGGIENHKKTA